MIVALKSQDVVYIAVDYLNTPIIGYDQSDILNTNNLSMWMPRKYTIIASTADFRTQDLMRFDDLLAQEINLKTLQLETVNKMKQILKDYGLLEKNMLPGEFMIASRHKIFDIDYHGLVTEYQYYRALGQSSQVMIAYLHKTKNTMMDPFERIRRGFELCEAYSKTLCFPICVMNTSNMEMRYLHR